MKFRALLIAAAALLAASPAYAATAVLRGLDKTSGQTQDFNVTVGKMVKFHSLEVTARTCSARPVEETPPEAWVYLEITDQPVADADEQAPERQKVFSGWMFQSSPALNALDHPTYDVWLIDCKA